MTFDEILAQIIDLLKRQGRVSYSALKRRFDLNDDYLNDLKDEILYVHPVRNDEGRGLIWTGDTASGQEVAAPPAQPTPQPVVQAQPATPVEPLSPAPPPDAERRQLTVMFCDLVDSTRLSSQLDPEEYRGVVRAYQKVCSDVITRFDGHVAQLLGDGLLVYFGYPQAHEDDAHRAVRTGLDILSAMRDLNQALQQTKGIQLAIRVGIHTGLVVVGEMGGAQRQEQLALGEVPNVCSRIEALAAPNTMAISEATYRLIQGYFECQDLGVQTLRGVPQPLKVYRVLEASGVFSRLDVAQPRGLTPLVGREQETGLLLERWEQAKAGHGQVVLLSGEAGIGKSRLAQTLKDHVANEPHVRWECRSVEHYQNTALFPVTDLFQRLLQFQAEATPNEKLAKLEQMLSQYRLPLEESVQLFAPLLSLPIPADTYPPLQLSPQRQRQKTLETLVAILQELAEHQPVLFILEDLHWTDPTTLELLNLVIEQIPTTSVLMLLTCRPTFQPSWSHRSYLSEITVSRLSHTQVEQIVHRITEGKTLPTEVLQQIIAKTDGVPLFIEELTKAILEAGYLQEVDGHYHLTGTVRSMAIPTTLQDSLMARLDRLVTAKAVAQYAAVIGRQFAYDLLSTVSQLDDVTLQRELGRLVEAEIVYQRGMPPQSTYVFKHALIQDAAAQSLLKSTRQQYHQRIAQVLEAQFAELVEAQPELLAQHYTAAGLTVEALGYWQQAGQRALARSANIEAIAHVTTGLELLRSLPDAPVWADQELRLLTILGPALMATRGYGAPEVEHTYARARALCQQVEDTPQLAQVLFGLWVFYFVRAEYQTAQELAEHVLTLAHRVQVPALLLAAHGGLAQTLFCLGELAQARALFERGLAYHDPQQHRALALVYGTDPAVFSLSWLAWSLWLLGYPDQATQQNCAALTFAHALGHALTLGSAQAWAAIFHALGRDAHATQAQAEAAMTLATEQGVPLRWAEGVLLHGWALVVRGRTEEGIAQLRQGMAAWRATGAEIAWPLWLAILAEAYGKAGHAGEEQTALTEALAHVNKTGERFWEAEIHRLQGEWLLSQGTGPGSVPTAAPERSIMAEAEACFARALDIARHQQAKSLELRASMSLARLWQQQGKRPAAHALLAPIYGWFTEGFDTADLQEARALVEELA